MTVGYNKYAGATQWEVWYANQLIYKGCSKKKCIDAMYDYIFSSGYEGFDQITEEDIEELNPENPKFKLAGIHIFVMHIVNW